MVANVVVSARPPTTNIALKEWDAVCKALADGAQTLLVRKGGIHEKQQRFQFEYDAFWIYPTFAHQRADQLKAEHAGRIRDGRDDAGALSIDTFCTVERIFKLAPAEKLRELEPFHVYAPSLVEMRIGYKPEKPLYLVLVRAYRCSEPYVVPIVAAYGGCRSWVRLAEPLATDALSPALDDPSFQGLADRIETALSGP